MSLPSGLKAEVAVVDLDGTLLRCNSFTEFVKFIFRRKPSLRFQLALIVLRRKLRLLSHSEAKQHILHLVAGKLHGGDINSFITRLHRYLNDDVVAFVSSCPKKLLATAAPALYARPLGDSLGFDEVVATEIGGDENKGEKKLDSVRKSGVTFGPGVAVVSDHSDDMPLFRANRDGINILVTSQGPEIITIANCRPTTGI